MEPTAEQQAAIDAAGRGGDVAIEALAGTGKTSTLTFVAQAMPRRAVYIAFNKAIVTDAKAKFGPHVDCRTAHSLAFRAVGGLYRARLKSPRLSDREKAEILGCRGVRLKVSGAVLDGLDLANYAWRTVLAFVKTADPTLGPDHVPKVPGLTAEDRSRLAEAVLPIASRAWDDLIDTNGKLQFIHDIYLKLWQLSGPRIRGSYIMFDESQDADRVMLDIVCAQEDAQLIFVTKGPRLS